MAERKPRAQSKGTCVFCGTSTAKGSMARHLEACAARAAAQAKGSPQAGSSLHLVVEATYIPQMWLHLEASGGATLLDLDRFLRQIWLERCGHLSAFRIDGKTYASSPDRDYGEGSMSKQIARVLPPGSSGTYEYDFGSTTDLRVRSLTAVPRASGEGPILLLARNELPVLACVECGESPATEICTECAFEDGGALCARCAPEHECGDEMQLPLVNSPRAGVCGYTG